MTQEGQATKEKNINWTSSKVKNFFAECRWLTSVIPAFRRQRQWDCRFEASLDYIVSSRPVWAIVRPFSKKTKKKKGGLAGPSNSFS
jgi:hypothetical protein